MKKTIFFSLFCLIIFFTQACLANSMSMPWQRPHQTLYQASALIQVNAPASSASNKSSSFTSSVSKASLAQVQTALIKSRFILKLLIEKLNLNISTNIKKTSLNRHYEEQGSEFIKVDELNMDPRIFNNNPLTLTANKNNQFTLSTQNGDTILKGTVGTLAISKKYPNTSILVSQINAHPQETFNVKLIPMKDIIKKLEENITITRVDQRMPKNYLNRNKRVLKISLKWPDRHQLPTILNTLLNISVQKNLQQKSEEVGQQLKFVEQQIPILKRSLNHSEQELNDYRSKKGNLNISSEAQQMIQVAAQLANQKMRLTLRRKSLLLRYMPSHPLIIHIKDQIKEIQGKMTQLDQQIKTLPHVDPQAVTLTRDVTTQEKLYAQLLARHQQLIVIKAGLVSDILILDSSSHLHVVSVNKSQALWNNTLKTLKLSFKLLSIKMSDLLT
jgi:tyrosine-protein kinase Etk/Wzc